VNLIKLFSILAIFLFSNLVGCTSKKIDFMVGNWETVEAQQSEHGKTRGTLNFERLNTVTMIAEFLEFDDKMVSSGSYSFDGNVLSLNLVRHSGVTNDKPIEHKENDPVVINFKFTKINQDTIILTNSDDNIPIKFTRK
jgi:hypothetical protein